VLSVGEGDFVGFPVGELEGSTVGVEDGITLGGEVATGGNIPPTFLSDSDPSLANTRKYKGRPIAANKRRRMTNRKQ
jgi:hypothetical protein